MSPINNMLETFQPVRDQNVGWSSQAEVGALMSCSVMASIPCSSLVFKQELKRHRLIRFHRELPLLGA
jgi:hypothetical protein